MLRGLVQILETIDELWYNNANEKIHSGAVMKNDFINNMLRILNGSSDTHEKLRDLRKEKTRRRGKNRIIIGVIIELLDQHTLSIDITDDLFIIDIKEFTEKEYKILETIASRSTYHYFQAVSFDILWKHWRKLELANKAMDAYLEALETERDAYLRAALTASICRIYSRTKSNGFDMSKFQHFCIDTLIPSFPNSNNYTDIVLKALLLGAFCKDIEQYTIGLIGKRKQSKDYISAIFLAEILVEIYKKEKRVDDQQLWLCNLAKYNESAANLLNWNDAKCALKIIQLIHKSMRLWKASKHNDASQERNRLAKKIEPVKKLFLESIKSIPGGKFDLTETINRMRSITENSSLEECIWNFIHAIKLITPDDLKNRHTENGFSLSSFFGTTVLDSDGRKKCIIPALHNSDPNEQQHILEHEAEEDYRMFADAFISRYLYIIRDHFSFTEENLQFIVDNNVFIPENRKKSFLKGLIAGFNSDYITALSILMPQVENAIRCLAHDCGAVVYKTNDDGTEDCLSLESILNLPEINQSIDPVFLFNLRVFYTSKYGLGMRNIVSHGLVSDAELSSYQGLIVWWFTLYICCIFSPELIRRVSQKIEEKNN